MLARNSDVDPGDSNIHGICSCFGPINSLIVSPLPAMELLLAEAP